MVVMMKVSRADTGRGNRWKWGFVIFFFSLSTVVFLFPAFTLVVTVLSSHQKAFGLLSKPLTSYPGFLVGKRFDCVCDYHISSFPNLWVISVYQQRCVFVYFLFLFFFLISWLAASLNMTVLVSCLSLASKEWQMTNVAVVKATN